MLILSNIVWNYPFLSMYFSLSIQKAERVAILGPSGSGKSTLLNLIAGFLLPNSGRIKLNGLDHTHTLPAHRPVSILFQENNLFAHLTIAQNIGLGLHPGLKLNAEQHQQIQKISQRVKLESKLNLFPNQLSIGQRQRAALARCLIRKKPILLLDEPFSSLDPALRQEMLMLVDEICYENKLTLLMVSHDLSDAKKITTRTILVVNGYINWDGITSDLLLDSEEINKIFGTYYQN